MASPAAGVSEFSWAGGSLCGCDCSSCLRAVGAGAAGGGGGGCGGCIGARGGTGGGTGEKAYCGYGYWQGYCCGRRACCYDGQMHSVRLARGAAVRGQGEGAGEPAEEEGG